jgi:cytochrome P450
VMILNADGDEHLRLRRLVAKAFTPPAVERLRPFMRASANELIDSFVQRGECDFVAAFADRYPGQIICELLGVPAGTERERFAAWANDLGLAFGFEATVHRARIETAVLALSRWAEAQIAERRRHPGPDLISALIVAEESGSQLSGDELRAMVVALVFAGNDTTRNQLGLAMAAFLDYPAQWAALAQHPQFAPRAVEEVLRTYSAVPGVTRIVAEDFEFQGLPLRAGTLLTLLLGAANADPAVFGTSGFDITLERPAQLTFSSGIHHCLGNWLARAELQEALPLLAARLREPQLAATPTWGPGLGIRGPLTLPIRFRAAKLIPQRIE